MRTESIAEVEEAIDLIETYCLQVESAEGFETPLGQLSPDERNTDVLRPYGVFGVIAPFNFPFALGFGMTAAALACGQRRGPEATGGGVRRRAEPSRACSPRQGVPDGVISLVHGGPATGEALVGSAIDGVAFTGSAEVGREIGRRLSEGPYPRPVLAEMGGKNAAVVGASADLEAAAEGIAKAAFGFSGQKCSACARAIVVDEVHDELVDRLAAHRDDVLRRRPGRSRRRHRPGREQAGGRAVRALGRGGSRATAPLQPAATEATTPAGSSSRRSSPTCRRGIR